MKSYKGVYISIYCIITGLFAVMLTALSAVAYLSAVDMCMKEVYEESVGAFIDIAKGDTLNQNIVPDGKSDEVALKKGEELPDNMLNVIDKSIKESKAIPCRVSNQKVLLNGFIDTASKEKYVVLADYEKNFSQVKAFRNRLCLTTFLLWLLSAAITAYIVRRLLKRQAERKDKNENESEKLKSYSQSQRNEEIRDCILFNHTKDIDIFGYVVLFEVYNTGFGGIYISHVFNMVKTYIESNPLIKSDFIVLDKRRAVAVFNTQEQDAVREICERAVQDAALCDVVCSAFIGSTVKSIQELQDEFVVCQQMAKYQLMHKNGVVYDYTQYLEDEEKPLCFPQSDLDTAVGIIISSDSPDIRKKEIESYLNIIFNNSIDNYVYGYNQMIGAMQSVYNKTMGENREKFVDIDAAMLTAEIYDDILNGLESVAQIVSETYLRELRKEKFSYGDIRNFIKTNIDNTQLSPSMIAAAFNKSSRKMSSEFKEEVGHTLLEEINIIRLERVAKMLLSTNVPIKIIMNKCGFINESNFYKLFKKYYNVTPAEYKKQFKNA